MAQADLALGGFLLRPCRPQRNRVEDPDNRFLGRLQGLRRVAADVLVRRGAVSADVEIRRAGGEPEGASTIAQGHHGLLPQEGGAGVTSALSIAGCNAFSRLSGVIGPISL